VSLRFPERLKIGGRNYKVIYPYTFTERFDRLGEVDYEIQEIRIAHLSNSLQRSKVSIKFHSSTNLSMQLVSFTEPGLMITKPQRNTGLNSYQKAFTKL